MIKRYITEPWGRMLRSPAFVVCTVVLAVCAGGLHAGARWLQWHFRKLEVPLRKSFEELDETKLGPYRVVSKSKIADEEVESELGTRDYIQWVLEDTQAEKDDPTRFATLFITYYTGNPDKVPHVPDWCYVGSGGIVEEKYNTKIKVPHIGLESKNDELPVRVLEISMPSRLMGRRRQMVTYFFSVNGTYACTRTEVRLIQNNWRDKYAYFSKVEIAFAGEQEVSPAQSLAGAEKLCRQIVPLLHSEHWPDWSKLQ